MNRPPPALAGAAHLRRGDPLWRGGRHGAGGFSAIELMMTLSIGAVLLILAAPSLEEIIRNNRLSAQIEQLTFSLNLARSEAVKRGIPVTVCKTSNGTGCQTGGVNWESGWMVFSDNDQDQTYEVSDGEVIVQITQALPDGFTLRGSADVANAVTFSANGYSLAQGTMVLCAGNRIDHARSVGVNLAGRIRQGPDTDEDGIPAALDGTEITSCTSP